MKCTVYKSLRQFDYYLYVPSEAGLSGLPEGLLSLLGDLNKVIELELHAQRNLAQADVVEVMRQINETGYFLQMPPCSESAPLVS
jgi:uncharacterized protein YcgL (UPF0745 family)